MNAELTKDSPPGGLRGRLARFFMAEEAPFALALARMMLPAVLLYEFGVRWAHARELYSSDGAPAQLALMYGHCRMLPELPASTVVVLFSLLLLFFASSMVGWCTRFSLWGAFLLSTYFGLLDCTGSLTKYSVIASHTLLLLAVSNCGAVWSVDALLARRGRLLWPGDAETDVPRFPAWPRRLMALMIGIVYFGAAITKLHTPAYFSGDQLLYWMITQVNSRNPLGEWLTLVPWLLVVMAYVAVVWEVLFVFLCWKGWGRISMIGLGVLFHAMTALTLGLYVFPLVCFATYFAFLDESDVRRTAAAVRRFARRRLGRRGTSPAPVPTPAPALSLARFVPRLSAPGWLATAMIVVALAGLWGEHLLDPYGLRRPEGPHELVELDRETAEEYLRPDQRIRPEDMVFSFDAGTDMLGGILCGIRREFRQGERVLLQAIFAPPHADMWVECNLHDADGRLVEQVGQILSREMLRGDWNYVLGDALEPGRYDFVLKVSGRDVVRRSIELLPRTGSALGN